MNGEDGWNAGKFVIKRITIFDHERYQPGVVIVAMDYIGLVLPFTDPIAYGNLKRDETFGIVFIPVYFFPIKQAIDVYKVQVDS